MKKQIIVIKTTDGDKEIQAETKGDWAIHKTWEENGNPKTYSLTYIPTGLTAVRRCQFKKNLIYMLPQVIETYKQYPNLPNKEFYKFLTGNFYSWEIF